MAGAEDLVGHLAEEGLAVAGKVPSQIIIFTKIAIYVSV